VLSTSGNSAVLGNVLVGDVFVCGGQSNMQFTLIEVFNASVEIADAINYPDIRVMTVGQGTISSVPLAIFETIEQHWSVGSSKSVGGKAWTVFSAVCWLTAKYTYDVHKIPIGLVSSNWGGTIIQAWSSPEALSKCKMPPMQTVPMNKTFNTAMHYSGPNPNKYSVLWNAMIVPLLGSAIKGVFWYQGESNTIYINDIGPYYACAFPAMINDWREQWWGTSKEFGFYYVQIGTWLDDIQTTLEYTIRLAQDYALQLSNVGVAVAHDLGDPTSPWGDIHPRDKETVGERLSLVVRALTYGEVLQYQGPSAVGVTHILSGKNILASVSFDPSTLGEGLILIPKTCDVPKHPNNCAGFEICIDGVWKETTTVRVIGQLLVIVGHGTHSSKFCGVRYALANYPLASLYNRNGLPALPFAFPPVF